MSIVYLNGEFLPLEQASISVLDRGFTFGDGVYEIIPVFNGRIFRLQEHLVRLHNSMSAIYIDNPYPLQKWHEILNELLLKNPPDQNYSIYIQLSRGVGERDHSFSSEVTPTVFAMCKPFLERDFSQGVSAVTHEDIRWKYCHIKATALLPSVLLKKHARDKGGAMEAILTRDGMVTEGAASNVFLVRNDRIKTPCKDGTVLAGITRDLLVELMQENGMDCIETGIAEKELRLVHELWITSSTIGVVPVISLDGEKIGDGKPGKIWKQASLLYEQFKLNNLADQ